MGRHHGKFDRGTGLRTEELLDIELSFFSDSSPSSDLAITNTSSRLELSQQTLPPPKEYSRAHSTREGQR